jgi:hypothetical protein
MAIKSSYHFSEVSGSDVEPLVVILTSIPSRITGPWWLIIGWRITVGVIIVEGPIGRPRRVIIPLWTITSQMSRLITSITSPVSVVVVGAVVIVVIEAIPIIVVVIIVIVIVVIVVVRTVPTRAAISQQMSSPSTSMTCGYIAWPVSIGARGGVVYHC